MASTVPLHLAFAVVLLWIIDCTRIALRKGLRTLPGPFLAKISGLYRLSLVYNGDAPRRYRKLHEEYGPIVRVGPNHVSVSDASMIPIIYGIGSSYMKVNQPLRWNSLSKLTTSLTWIKTPFYKTMTPFVNGKILESMFTTRDPAYHKALKGPVAQLFSMTNMRNYETYADECTSIFAQAMRSLHGQPVDLAIWLQWYAFDVIASITFQRRFGFMEQQQDVHNLISGLDAGLQYVKLVGQFPALHPWLMGNRPLMNFLASVFPNLPDPLAKFIEAGPLLDNARSILTEHQITEEEIMRYDLQEKQSERTDFLAQLRSRGDKMTQMDMLNHLSNNL